MNHLYIQSFFVDIVALFSFFCCLRMKHQKRKSRGEIDSRKKSRYKKDEESKKSNPFIGRLWCWGKKGEEMLLLLFRIVDSFPPTENKTKSINFKNTRLVCIVHLKFLRAMISQGRRCIRYNSKEKESKNKKGKIETTGRILIEKCRGLVLNNIKTKARD